MTQTRAAEIGPLTGLRARINSSIARLSGIGWLPTSQGLSLLASIATFGVLSRLLEPDQYARFSVLLFIFTIVTLATDLSALGYLLVYGESSATRRSSWRTTAVSTVVGASALIMVLCIVRLLPVPLGPPSITEIATLALGLIGQAASQTPRGLLLVRRKYASIALTDGLSSLTGYAASIVMALGGFGREALIVQLTSTLVLRGIILTPLALYSRPAPVRQDHSRAPNALTYGLKVLPISLASYAGRSIDSGILPLILPPAAAASYARSYQLIVTPVTQLQLSLGAAMVERISNGRRRRRDQRLESKIWRTMSAATLITAVLISFGAPVLRVIFFGPNWTHVTEMIAAMACLLPSMTLSAFIAWKLQIAARFSQSIRNLLVLLLVPMLAILLAIPFGTFGAVGGIVGGALLQSLLLSLILPASLPIAREKLILQLIVEWCLLVAILLAVVLFRA